MYGVLLDVLEELGKDDSDGGALPIPVSLTASASSECCLPRMLLLRFAVITDVARLNPIPSQILLLARPLARLGLLLLTTAAPLAPHTLFLRNKLVVQEVERGVMPVDASTAPERRSFFKGRSRRRPFIPARVPCRVRLGTWAAVNEHASLPVASVDEAAVFASSSGCF